MERISISDLYRGESSGEKYGGILNAVMQEVFTNGIPEGCEEITWLELLTVKHTFLIAKQMAEQGDVVSELTDAAPPCSIEGEEEQPCSGDAAKGRACRFEQSSTRLPVAAHRAAGAERACSVRH